MIMEIRLSELKKKSVINFYDGKCLGKIEDVIFSYPEGAVKSVVVCDRKFVFGGERLVIELCCINKIGDDTILVELKEEKIEK